MIEGTRYQTSRTANRFPPILPDVVDRRVADAVQAGTLDAGLARRVRFMARMLSGQRLSGEVLAGALGISRAAVHKYAVALRAAGVGLESVPGSGYQLVEWEDLLLPETVLPLLLGPGRSDPPAEGGGGRSAYQLGLPYLYAPAVESTNAWLKEEAEGGLPEGAVAVTDHQVGGRGRLGRTWTSEAGRDLTFSMLLRPELPPAEAPRLVFATALAVAEAVADVGLGARVGMKWPNDVLVDRRKVCGILSEVSMDMDRLHWVVIGIGLNVNSRPEEMLAPAVHQADRPLPASVGGCLGRTVTRGPLLVDLLARLGQRWRQIEEGGWEQVLEACRQLDLLRGQPVRVSSGRGGQQPVVGLGGGFGPDGELLVVGEDGETRMVVAGDVTLA